MLKKLVTLSRTIDTFIYQIQHLSVSQWDVEYPCEVFTKDHYQE